MRSPAPVAIILFAAVCFGQQTSPSTAPPAPDRRIVCDHAAPPPGMHWECPDRERPCDCKLEGQRQPTADDDMIPRIPLDAAVCTNAKVQKFVAPDYPPVARTARLQGTIRLKALVDPDGNVTAAEIISGPPMLAQPVKSAISAWEFRNNRNACVVSVRVRFRLLKAARDSGIVQMRAELPSLIEIVAVPPEIQGSY